MKIRIYLLIILSLILIEFKSFAQTPVTLANYDFNTGTSFSTFTPTLLSGIACTLSSTEAFITYSGVVSGANAFTSNTTSGNALGMANSSGTNTRYHTFAFSGSALSNYINFKVYTQAQRSSTGATTLTLAYSTNGTTYTNFATTKSTGTSFAECLFDLSAITTLYNQATVYIRLMASGASSTGTLRIDNFQLQGVYSATASPSVLVSQSFTEFISMGVGSSSSDQNINVSGTNLTNDIILTAPSGFELYNSTTSSYVNSLTLTQSAGTVNNTRIGVRYNPASLSTQPQSAGTQLSISSTGTSTQYVDLYGSIINLSQGDIAMIGINSSTTDAISFVAINTIPAGTIIKFTDNGYSDTATQMITEGIITYTAPSTINPGTVVNWTYGMSIAGTGWNISAPTGFSLTTSGDQLFAFQGSWGTTNTNTRLLEGYNFGNSGWTSSGTVSSVSANSYRPTALITGYMTTSQNNLYFTNTFSNVTRTPSALFGASFVSSNWTLSSSAVTFPTWSFNLLANEPTNQGGFSGINAISDTSVSFNFNGGNGSRNIILMKKGVISSAIPSDGIAYNADTLFGNGYAFGANEFAIYNGTLPSGSIFVSKLSPGTKYYFTIFTYNGTTNASNYLTTPIVIDSFTTTGSAGALQSIIQSDTLFSYPTLIPYLQYQASTIGSNNHANDIEVARFNLVDGNGTPDNDPFSTTLDSLYISITNPSLIQKIAIYSDTTKIVEKSAASGIGFKGLNIVAPDDQYKTFSIYVSFNSTVSDTQQFSFKILAATALNSGSVFSSGNAGGAVSPTSGNINRVDVIADRLVFAQQPTSVVKGIAMTPMVKVNAIDINNNRDYGFSNAVQMSTTGTLDTNAVTTMNAYQGQASFSFLLFSGIGTGFTMDAAANGLISTGTSNSFSVYKSGLPGDVIISEIMYNAPTGSYEWAELQNKTPDTIFISNWYITDASAYPPTNEGAVTIPSGIYLLPHEFRTISLNGGAVGTTTYDIPDVTNEIRPTVSYSTGGIALNNSGDNLALYTSATNGTLIDGSLSVLFSNKGASGISIERYKDSVWTATAWAASTTPYTSTYYTKCTPSADNIPPRPAAVTHSNVTASSFIARWNRVTGNTNYLLDVATDSTFNSIVSGYNSINIADTFKVVSGMSSSTIYYFRVRTFSKSGNSSAYTNFDTTLTKSNGLTLTIHALFEGAFLGSNRLTSTLYNCDNSYPQNLYDSVTVNLYDSANNLNLVYSKTIVFDTSGTGVLSIPSNYTTGNYYISIKQRNHIETWSANTLVLNANQNFNFSNNPANVYGANVLDIGNGNYVIYGGDVNLDGVVSNDDMVQLDNDNFNFVAGYSVSDLNGDGTVNNDDIVILDNNNSNFIASMHP